VGWGLNDHGQAEPPKGNDFIAVAAGGFHSLALRKDGSVVAWGANDFGQAEPVQGHDFRAIDGGLYHSIALRSDGSVVTWGYVPDETASESLGSGFVSVEAGGYCNYALSPATSYCACAGAGQVTPTGFTSTAGVHNSFGFLSSASSGVSSFGLEGLAGGYWGGGGGGGSITRDGPSEPPFVIPEPGTISVALGALLAAAVGWWWGQRKPRSAQVGLS
jgi:hypothetical protein